MRTHKRGSPVICIKKNTPNWASYRCVFLLVYLLLAKITANAITKAIAMIVIPSSP